MIDQNKHLKVIHYFLSNPFTSKTMKKTKKIIIIGAGAAGLEAAHQLSLANIEFELLEANNYVGGRIKALENWSDMPIELGAEFIHGTNSIHYQYALQAGCIMKPQGPDCLELLNGKEIIKGSEEEIAKVQANQLLANPLKTMYLNDDGSEMNLKQLIEKEQFCPNMKAVALTYSLSYCGTDFENVGAHSSIHADSSYFKIYGDETIHCLNMTNEQILKATYGQQLWDKAKLNIVVSKIDYSGSGVVVTDTHGNTYEGSGVIITVPITILQDGDIKFVPELPYDKQRAINAVKMDAMIKIFIRFKEKFWPDNFMFHQFNGLIGTIWNSGLFGKSQENNVLTFHCGGSHAKFLSELSEEDLREEILKTLETFYGETPRKLFDKMIVKDWTKEKFIRGGYSAPTVNEGDCRKTFTKPVHSKIMFAGEAYQELGRTSTIAPALESGRKAAQFFITLQQPHL